MRVRLFVYGSLVSPESLAATIGEVPTAEQGPAPALLRDHVREWSVGSDCRSHPERVLIDEDGAPFTGTLAVLGLRVAAGSACTGAVYDLAESALERLRCRERNYRLVDVTEHVTALALGGSARPVVTFLPRADAVERLRTARSSGTAVVRTAYAEGVAAAFRRLGPGQEENYARTTVAHGLPVRRIAIRG